MTVAKEAMRNCVGGLPGKMPVSRWRSVVRVALWCGLGASLVGTALLHVVSGLSFAGRTRAVEPLGWSHAGRFLMFLAYGLVIVGPLAFAEGILGGWLLVRWAARGISLRILYVRGALFGLSSGALVLLLLIGSEGLNPSNPYVITALVTGLILGIASARLAGGPSRR